MRDITLADTVYIGFTTRAFATGIPTVLSGTPVVSAYEDAGLTQITAGITLGVDHDGVVGLNMLTIVATGANGFEDNKDYNLVITTGTVGGVSVVGEVVGQFSIQRSPVNWANVSNPTTAVDLSGTDIQLVDTVTTYTGNTLQTANVATRVPNVLNTTATGNIGIDWANVENPTTALDLSGTDIQLVDTATDVTNQVTANVTAISGDTTAADNLELQYDTTGLSGDTFPATQSQVGSLAVGSAAISIQAESYTLTTGTQSSGTVSDTETLDAVYHEHTDTAGALELYYQFDVTGAGIATETTVIGRMNDANDNLDGIYAYDWVGAAWDRIGDYAGQGSTTDTNLAFSLLTRHTGTGANLGKVRIRFYAASGITTGTLHIDQIFTSYSVVAQTVGYANGAVWINTVSGVAGTESYVNGVADNPTDSLADAVTIAGNLSLHNFELSNDSAITFVSTHADHVFKGRGYTIALGGQAATGSHIIGGTISGTATTTGDEIHFTDCEVGTCTLGAAHLETCGLTATITLSQATTYTLQTCHSEIAGAGSPIIDFGAAIGNTNLNVRRYSGGIEVQNMGQTGTDTMSLEGNGALTINANCTGGTIVLRGDFSVTNNGSATLTYDDNTTNIALLATDTHAEPGQGAPAATTTMIEKIDYLYKNWRNKKEQTSSTFSLYDDAGTTVDQKSTVADAAGTSSKAEIVTGP